MASRTQKIETESTRRSVDDLSAALTDAVDQSQIAAAAYELWQARGCPVGSPEDDWFRAERELKAAQHESPSVLSFTGGPQPVKVKCLPNASGFQSDLSGGEAQQNRQSQP